MGFLKKLFGGDARNMQSFGPDVYKKEGKTIDNSRCMICKCELNFQRYVSGIFTGNPENIFDRHAYRCRQCGAPIYFACAPKSRCLVGESNVFELDTERVK